MVSASHENGLDALTRRLPAYASVPLGSSLVLRQDSAGRRLRAETFHGRAGPAFSVHEVRMNWRAFLAGGGLLTVAAVSVGATHQYVARRASDAVAAYAGGVKAEQIVVDPWRGETRIFGLALQTPGLAIRVGALRLVSETPYFWFVAPALAKTDTASAEDVTIETDLATYKIKRIDLSGASLSPAELARILASKSSAPIAERLGELSAAAIMIPELVAETKLGPMTQKILYRDIALNGVAQGRVAGATAAGASFSISDPQWGDTEGAYGHISANAIDLVLAARIMSGTRDDADQRKMPLYDDFAVDGFRLANLKTGVKLDIGAVAGRGVKGRPSHLPVAAPAENGHPPSDQEDHSEFPLVDLLDSFAIDEMTASHVKLDFRQDEEPVSLTMSRATLSQFDGPRIGAIESKESTLRTTTTQIGLATLAFRGIDLDDFLDILADAAATRAKTAPGAKINDFLPSFEQMVLTKLDVGFFNPDAGQGKKRVADALSLERLEIDAPDQKAGSPIPIDASLDHLTSRPGDFSTAPFEYLTAMGYSRLDLSSRLGLVWTEASHELAIKAFSLEGADMGRLEISGLVGNVTDEMTSANDEVAMAAAQNVILKKFELLFQNSGLIDKALTLQAKNQQKTAAETKQADAMAATILLPALFGNSPPAKAIGAALAKFVADPKSFHLIAAAPKGLGVADLEVAKTPGALFDKIDIEVSANQ